MRPLGAIAAVGAAALLLGAAGSASAADPQDIANDLSTKIASPYCPGVTLHDCPSSQAIALRARIASWADEGLSRRQIMSRLESQFGPSIRAVPTARGMGLLAWWLPVAVALAGAAAVVFVVPRWARKRRFEPVHGPEGRPPTPDERRRLEAELAGMRRR